MNQGDMFGITLAQAREETMLAARTKAIRCPCCDKNVKVYRRKFNSGMALTMIYTYPLFNQYSGKFLDVLHYCAKYHNYIAGEIGKLVWWGLMERQSVESETGGKGSGKYRMTPKGFQFTLNKRTVPSHAIEYLSNVESFVGDEITIEQALGRHFNYRELMRGPALELVQ